MNKKETKELLRAVAAQGFQVSTTRKGHHMIRDADGRFITVLPGTPSDRRGLANALAALRRAGFVWPTKGR